MGVAIAPPRRKTIRVPGVGARIRYIGADPAFAGVLPVGHVRRLVVDRAAPGNPALVVTATPTSAHGLTWRLADAAPADGDDSRWFDLPLFDVGGG